MPNLIEQFLGTGGREDLKFMADSLTGVRKQVDDLNTRGLKLEFDIKGVKNLEEFINKSKELDGLSKELLQTMKTMAEVEKLKAQTEYFAAKSAKERTKETKEAKSAIDAEIESIRKSQQELRKLVDEQNRKLKITKDSTQADRDAKRAADEFSAGLKQFAKEMEASAKATEKELAALQKANSLWAITDKKHQQLVKTAREVGIEFGVESKEFLEAAQAANKVGDNLMLIDARLNNHRRNVGNYASSYNGLATSIGYVTSELPNLSQGFDLFFRSVGNNIIPIWQDIKRLREENAKLVSQGQQSVSVWQQVGKAIFSWQTALSVAVALLVSQGGKLIDFLTGVTRATREADASLQNFKRSVKGVSDQYDDLSSSLTRAEKVQVAKAQAEGKSEEEITAIVKENLQKRIDNAKEYAAKFKTLQEQQSETIIRMRKDNENKMFDPYSKEVLEKQEQALNESLRERLSLEKEAKDLEAEMEVKGFELKAYLREQDKKQRDKDLEDHKKYLEKRRQAEEEIAKAVNLNKSKPGMDELNNTAAGLNPSTGVVPDVLSRQASEMAIRELTELDIRYAKELTRFENTKFKNKEEKEKALTALQLKYAEERYQIERKALEAQIALLPIDSKERLDLLRQLANAELEVTKQKNDAINSEEEKQKAKRKKMFEELRGYATSTFRSIAEVISNSSESRISNLSAQQKANEEANKQEIDQISASALSQEEKNERIAASNAKLQAKNSALRNQEAEERKKQAMFERSLAIMQVVFHTAKAVAEALPNIPLSIAAGTAGAAQIAAILSQPIPQYFKGTPDGGHPASGMAIVGERGQELRINPDKTIELTPATATKTFLEKGTHIISADRTKDILNSIQLASLNSYVSNHTKDTGYHKLAKAYTDASNRSTDKIVSAINRKNNKLGSRRYFPANFNYYLNQKNKS